MITLTQSQDAASDASGVEPRTLVELDSLFGRLRIAAEDLRWSGLNYEGRLVNPGDVSMALGDTGGGIAAAKTVSVELANPDGYFTRQRPNFLRGRAMTIKEIFLDVDSDPVRTFGFTVTHGDMTDRGTYTVYGEDALASVRRRPFPSSRVLITRELFPDLPDGSPDEGKPIPVIFGSVITPIYLVDLTQPLPTQGVFVCCVGCASAIANVGALEFDSRYQRLSPVASVTFATSVVGGIPMTFCTQTAPVFDSSNGIFDHYAALTWGRPPGESAVEDVPLVRVLNHMLQDSHYGMDMPAPVVSSASQVTAWSFHSGAFIDGFLFANCALTQQRPLEQWLDDWTHDALTSISIRDTQLQLLPQNSRTAVASFYPGNILADTLRLRDDPLGQEASRRQLFFREKGAVAPTAVQCWAASSGQELSRVSPFLGDRICAATTVQFWSKHEAGGVRHYSLETTVKNVALEEGDLVTLTHSLVGATNQLCELESIQRREGVFAIEMREFTTDVFCGANLANIVHNVIERRFDVVANVVSYGQLIPASGTGTFVYTGAHAIYNQTPTFVLPIFSERKLANGVVNSLVLTNNSMFQISFVTNTDPFDTRAATDIVVYYVSV